MLLRQQESLVEALEQYGVRICWAKPLCDSPIQFNTRDVAVVIHDTLVICSMKEPVRQHEPEALENFLDKLESPTFQVSAGVIEGGDLIIDQDVLYVGLGERTDVCGLRWLEERFADRLDIVALRLKPSFLHLDVALNLVNDKLALVYPPALEAPALRTLHRRYQLIEVTRDEQATMATNVLSLSPKAVISDPRQARVNQILREHKIEVIELDFSEFTKLGGAFRCATCPLVRDRD